MVVFSLLSRFLLLITAQLRNPQRDPNSTSTLDKSHAQLNNTGRIASDHDRFSAATREALCRTRFIRAFFGKMDTGSSVENATSERSWSAFPIQRNRNAF
jgi:hypothetical protein